MKLSSKAAFVLLLLAFLLAGCSLGGVTASGEESDSPAQGVGAVEFALNLPNGEHVDTLDLHLVCQGFDQHHDVQVPDNSVVAAFGGLMPGPCHVAMTTVTDLGRNCFGESDFSIVAGETTAVTVTLLCQGENESPSGRVRIGVQFGTHDCMTDRIANLSAIPSEVQLGESALVQVETRPGEVVGVPTYWFALRNDASNTAEATLAVPPACAAGACMEVTCNGVGTNPVVDPITGFLTADVAVDVTLEDDECFETRTVWVSCQQDSVCGDGFISGTEECDDSNTTDGDGCSSLCAHEFCGDGVVNQGPGVEECDDHNSSNEDACTNACEVAECQDGFIHLGVEECDDGNSSNEDACTNSCENAACGDGFVHAGVEECDDGNAINQDACTNACEIAACGDGFVHAGVEECDDGNVLNDDDCTGLCLTAVCGDGYTQFGVEQCDDANSSSTDGCTTQCQSALISDDFSRTDSSSLGGVWTEVTSSAANAEISGGKLRLNGDNGAMRPLVKTSFSAQNTGSLAWSFEMDFTRTTEANPYFQFMQLGHSMVDNNQVTGVAVDLTWGSYGGAHNQFGYKNSGGTFTNALGGTTQLTGLHRVEVIVDVVARTFSIRIDGVLRVLSAGFRTAATTQVSEMRFFQHQMTSSATGRTIDNVVLTKALVSDTFSRVNSTVIGGVWTEFLAPFSPGDALISASRLVFNGANGSPASPLVSTSFPQQSAGQLTWAFTMAFTRTTEITYYQFMQLGDAMSVGSQSSGVAVDLTWGSYGGAHNQFGYKDSAGTFTNVMGGTTALSGSHYIVVVLDMASSNYDILVDGVVRATDVFFRDSNVLQISEMRFFQDQMDSTATARAIDNVALTSP